MLYHNPIHNKAQVTVPFPEPLHHINRQDIQVLPSVATPPIAGSPSQAEGSPAPHRSPTYTSISPTFDPGSRA